MSKDPIKNREHQRRYRLINLERKRASGRAYRARNLEKVAAYWVTRRQPRMEYVNALKMATGCEAILPDGSVCGYRLYPEGLDFDHLDPSAKLFDVGTNVASGNWTRVLEEIAKCRVVCACCHRHHSRVEGHNRNRRVDRSLPVDPQLSLFEEAS